MAGIVARRRPRRKSFNYRRLYWVLEHEAYLELKAKLLEDRAPYSPLRRKLAQLERWVCRTDGRLILKSATAEPAPAFDPGAVGGV